MNRPEPRDRSSDVGLFVACYSLQGAALLFAMAAYKYGGRLDSLTILQWLWTLGPVLVFVASGGYIVHRYRRSRGTAIRRFGFTVSSAALAVATLLTFAEVVVRLFSVRTPAGLSFAGTLLLPRSWEYVKARNAEELKSVPNNISYFVGDTLLGWTVGRNRRSTDGMYLSSTEGIRSPRRNMKYADCDAPYRIGIVGDSFTFGLEVPFEETWGFQLEKTLGAPCSVLNFGVDGYGVDQAYLRYLRDSRPWRPALTIFGFIGHDLIRTISVYGFVTFPGWFPFSKPRFDLDDGKLKLLNVPVIDAHAIIAKQEIADLPFIDYEPGYNPIDWQRHAFDFSRLIGFLTARFPRYPELNPRVSDNALQQLNRAIMLRFAQTVVRDGGIPIVVYLPSRSDFENKARPVKESLLADLQRSGIQTLDLTSCIVAVGQDRAFLRGHFHYSAEGNSAVAQCLLPTIRRELKRSRDLSSIGGRTTPPRLVIGPGSASDGRTAQRFSLRSPGQEPAGYLPRHTREHDGA